MDSNVVMWFSPHHNITDEVAQSSSAWCANNRGGNRPKSLNPSTLQQKASRACFFVYMCSGSSLT